MLLCRTWRVALRPRLAGGGCRTLRGWRGFTARRSIGSLLTGPLARALIALRTLIALLLGRARRLSPLCGSLSRASRGGRLSSGGWCRTLRAPLTLFLALFPALCGLALLAAGALGRACFFVRACGTRRALCLGTCILTAPFRTLATAILVRSAPFLAALLTGTAAIFVPFPLSLTHSGRKLARFARFGLGDGERGGVLRLGRRGIGRQHHQRQSGTREKQVCELHDPHSHFGTLRCS